MVLRIDGQVGHNHPNPLSSYVLRSSPASFPRHPYTRVPHSLRLFSLPPPSLRTNCVALLGSASSLPLFYLVHGCGDQCRSAVRPGFTECCDGPWTVTVRDEDHVAHEPGLHCSTQAVCTGARQRI